MKTTVERPSSERGAVLVHVALALLALMAFSSFVIDYGVLWTTRRQAQNAADAAALAGAVALAYDNATDFSNSGPAKTSAYAVAMSNPLWGQQPVVNIANDIGIEPCPDDDTATCVRVDIYRDAAHGNPLPTIFGQLVGLNQQGVRAMAMAKVAAVNAADCVKPFGLADKWLESLPPFSEASTYNPTGTNPNGPDSYTAPSATSSGTGFSALNDHGRALQLRLGQAGDTIHGGWFQPLRTGTLTDPFAATIRECLQGIFRVGDTVPKHPDTYAQLMTGPHRLSIGVNALVSMDPGATWNPALNNGHGGVTGSCVVTNSCMWNGQPAHYPMSPRVVSVPVFDLQHFLATGGPGVGQVRIVSFAGFFVNGMVGNDVSGYFVSKPGIVLPGGGSVHGPSTFTKLVGLVR